MGHTFFRVCPSRPTIDNKVLPLKLQGLFWGPGFKIDLVSFFKMCFHKKTKVLSNLRLGAML
ncbi:MAG: hypothetical protein DRR08_00485 [Candidatus Parabeggiatoa sp. nov. 2]|nr:MAG: hypothetical protein DRR08_00485 [Gammaproteobacteria bacterium]